MFVFVTIFMPKGIMGLVPQRLSRGQANAVPATERGAAQPAE
jgi:hypothetical protein